MTKPIHDSVVVITGASSGIGRATAIELASRGARVAVTSRDAAALGTLVRELTTSGGKAIYVAADVTREEELQEVARRAIAEWGRIDVWINNAAVALFAKFEDAPPDVYRRVIDTNFFGYVHGARAVLPHFKRRGRGILINVDSVTAGAPQPYTSAYVASKFAIRGWSSCLRMELSLEKQPDIHVCAILPAAIDTPLFQHAANYTGRAVKALDPVNPPERVSRAIAELIEAPQAELVVGRGGKFMMTNAALSPRAYEHTQARNIDRNHLQDKPAPPTTGNLFASQPPKAVDGGWREHGTMTAKARRATWAVAIVAGAAAVGVAIWSGGTFSRRE